MMIIMRTDASEKEIETVIERVKANGLNAHVSKGEERTVIGAVGDGRTSLSRPVPVHGWCRPGRADLAAL